MLITVAGAANMGLNHRKTNGKRKYRENTKNHPKKGAGYVLSQRNKNPIADLKLALNCIIDVSNYYKRKIEDSRAKKVL